MKTWMMPGGQRYTFFEDLADQPTLFAGGSAGCGKTTFLRTFLYNLLLRAPSGVARGAMFIIVDETKTDLIEFSALPHTLKFVYEPNEVMGALQYAFNIADDRLKRCAQTYRKECADEGDVYLIINNLHLVLAEFKGAARDLLLRICLRSKSSHVHVVATANVDAGTRIITDDVLTCFYARLVFRCATPQASKKLIQDDYAYDLPLGEAYYQKTNGALAHYHDMPVIPDSDIEARVRWWTDQMPRKRNFFNFFK